MKSGFINRLLDRAEKLEKDVIVDYMTEIAQERDLLMLIFDSMTEGMAVIDAEEQVIYINPSARNMLDLGDGPSTPELPLRRVIYHKALLALCRDSIQGNQPLHANEFKLDLPGGARMIKISMIPLERADVRFGTLLLFIDETENIKREQKLREAEKLAALTTMSAGMSHEIRNPLNSLSIHLQLLQRHFKKKGIDDQEVQDTMNLFTHEINRLNDVIEMFLAAARPSRPEYRLCSLYGMLTHTLELMEPEFRENAIQVTLHEKGRWPLIEADERQMEQVLINLFKNAIEAISSMPKQARAGKKKRVDIRMVRDEYDVTLIVEDAGSGIDAKDLPHIFEPYFTKKAKGTGLGLMVVDRIIREHKGTISARSKIGEGTQIIMTLPVAADQIPLLEQGKPPDIMENNPKADRNSKADRSSKG